MCLVCVLTRSEFYILTDSFAIDSRPPVRLQFPDPMTTTSFGLLATTNPECAAAAAAAAVLALSVADALPPPMVDWLLRPMLEKMRFLDYFGKRRYERTTNRLVCLLLGADRQ